MYVLGCFWHGHSCLIGTTDSAELVWKRTKTEKTTRLFRDLGYKVVEMWECDFREKCHSDKQLNRFGYRQLPEFFQKTRYRSQTEEDLLEAVLNDELFGMLEVSLTVPQEWTTDFHSELPPREYFAEMCPFFGNANVPFEKIGSHMQEHVRSEQLKEHLSRGHTDASFRFKEPKPRRLLIGVMDAEKVLVSTALLKWYLEHGIVVTEIFQVIEFQKAKCFKGFVEQVSKARRDGDADPDQAIVAETMKLLGNSGYGSVLLDKEKHRVISYHEGSARAADQVKKPRFLALTELGDEMFEVEMGKKSVCMNIPNYLGFHILQLGKLRMLEFYYDCLDVFLHRKDFEMCEQDTDSAYIAISKPNWQDLILPEYKADFANQLQGLCHLEDVDADMCWFPRTCCEKHIKHDKRTPLLFKVEWTGEEMISLCSKSYVCRGDESGLKFSCKGLQRSRLHNVFDKFQSVLDTRESEGVTNVGFRSHENTVFTYSQFRRGLGYYYAKREVCADGVSTKPLDMSL